MSEKSDKLRAMLEKEKERRIKLNNRIDLNSEYDLEILDKDSEKENISSKFINDFLEAYKIDDDSYKTKVFIASVKACLSNAWIKDRHIVNLIKCDRAMEVLEHIALNNSVIDVKEIADEIFNSHEDKDPLALLEFLLDG